MKPDLAAGLVELWTEYLAQRDPRFPPSLTDFMLWLREYEKPSNQQNVKSTRTSPQIPLTPREANYSASQPETAPVKTIEADAAQYIRDAPVGTVDTVQIQHLWQQGYSAPRIRHMLGLTVPISSIYSIVGKKR